eukprot:4685283-Pyramimonas_sp.AAC.1
MFRSMRRRTPFTLYRGANSQRNWLRQHCPTDSADVRGPFASGETCYDIGYVSTKKGTLRMTRASRLSPE